VGRPLLVLIAGCFVLGAGPAARCGVPDKPAIGAVIKDLAAHDVLGAPFSLAQVDRGKLVVFAFVGVDCPLAKLYTPRLVELVGKYQPRGVVFIAVDANRQDSVTQITAYARRQAAAFPVLKDLRQIIADRLGATRTPQVVVLDRERRIRYRGRIDDQFGFVPTNRAASYRRPKRDRNDLQRALDELLAGTPVSVPETDSVGCLIGRDREPSAHPAVTYAKDVAPILNKRCVSCHRPQQIAPFALTSYAETVGWADMIAEVTELNRMPPWHADPKYGSFRNDARLTDKEKRILAQWAAAGAPQGDRRDLPEPPKFADGWMIPEPDEVISMSQQPYDIPATGIIPYQNFVVDPGWKEDRWLSAIEARPGNPSVVHHILIFLIPPDGDRKDFLRADDMYLATYIPGAQPEMLAPGFARPVRAGSKFLFNIHYTPNGSPQQDRSYLGVKFADPGSVVKEVTVSCAFDMGFRIPPGVSNQEVTCQYVFQRDSVLLSLIPHMHYRGKDFLYEAHYPNGDVETLLSVPHYDFGWQTVYRLKDPKVVPRGTIIKCVAHYDNSEANLNNPNPKATVKWGEQTFDEMLIGAFEVAPAADGLVSRTPWWRPLVSQLSAEAVGAIILTTVNLVLVGALVVGRMRSRKRSAAPGVPSSATFGDSRVSE
jgi:thiol-disulfide isomerase/thioredoxin